MHKTYNIGSTPFDEAKWYKEFTEKALDSYNYKSNPNEILEMWKYGKYQGLARTNPNIRCHWYKDICRMLNIQLDETKDNIPIPPRLYSKAERAVIIGKGEFGSVSNTIWLRTDDISNWAEILKNSKLFPQNIGF